MVESNNQPKERYFVFNPDAYQEKTKSLFEATASLAVLSDKVPGEKSVRLWTDAFGTEDEARAAQAQSPATEILGKGIKGEFITSSNFLLRLGTADRSRVEDHYNQPVRKAAIAAAAARI